MRSLDELFNSDEPLLDELQPYVIETELGPWVKHPLVVMPLIKPALINEKYIQLTRYVQNNPYYLGIYERPFRLDKIVEWWRNDELPDEKLVELLAWAWPDTESDDTLQNEFIRDHILPLFSHLGFISDREDLVLPEQPIAVFRGGSPDGIAWSESLETAKWFAIRFAPHQPVYEAVAHPENILARFHGRNELEVVIDPRTLENIVLLIHGDEAVEMTARDVLIGLLKNIEDRP